MKPASSQPVALRTIEFTIARAAPNDRILIRLDGRGGDLGFAPPFVPAQAVSAAPGADAGVEFVSVGGAEVMIAMDGLHGDCGPSEFRLRVGLSVGSDPERFALSADAAPGTRVSASIGGQPALPLGPVPRSFAYGAGRLRSDFAGGPAPATQTS